MDYGQPPVSPQMPQINYPYDYDPALNGIGGWLVLVIIGRFLTMIVGIKDIADVSALLGLEPSLDGLLYFAIVFDAAVYVVLSAVTLYFLFTRKIVFRLLFVIQVAAVFVITVLMNMYLDSRGYETSYSALFSTIVTGAIWIAYLYKSKRVKNTYIYPYQSFGEGPTL